MQADWKSSRGQAVSHETSPDGSTLCAMVGPRSEGRGVGTERSKAGRGLPRLGYSGRLLLVAAVAAVFPLASLVTPLPRELAFAVAGAALIVLVCLLHPIVAVAAVLRASAGSDPAGGAG